MKNLGLASLNRGIHIAFVIICTSGDSLLILKKTTTTFTEGILWKKILFNVSLVFQTTINL